MFSKIYSQQTNCGGKQVHSNHDGVNRIDSSPEFGGVNFGGGMVSPQISSYSLSLHHKPSNKRPDVSEPSKKDRVCRSNSSSVITIALIHIGGRRILNGADLRTVVGCPTYLAALGSNTTNPGNASRVASAANSLAECSRNTHFHSRHHS